MKKRNIVINVICGLLFGLFFSDKMIFVNGYPKITYLYPVDTDISFLFKYVIIKILVLAVIIAINIFIKNILNNFKNKRTKSLVDYSSNIQKKFLISSYKIIINNLKMYAKFKINEFSYIFLNRYIFDNSPQYSKREKYIFAYEYLEIFNYVKTDMVKPISSPLLKVDGVPHKSLLLFPLLLWLFFMFIYSILKKKNVLVLILGSILCKFIGVVIFEPSVSLIYYYYIYLFGLLFILYMIVNAVKKRN